MKNDGFLMARLIYNRDLILTLVVGGQNAKYYIIANNENSCKETV